MQRRAKVKTGCATYRVRKAKCDEAKPSCRKCIDTGRICDGYESPFRFFTSQPISSGRPPLEGGINPKSGAVITPQDIDLLSWYFSTKTMFDGVKLGCTEEASQVLCASMTDPAIRHAILSLRALPQYLETSQHGSNSHDEYSLQQYCMALGRLSSNLFPWSSSDGLKPGNFLAMTQHMVHELRIMREQRRLAERQRSFGLAPTDPPCLLDVFVIKLFATPCKFADHTPRPAKAASSAAELGVRESANAAVESRSRQLCTIAPDMRTELTRIAASTIELLDKLASHRAGWVDDMSSLQKEKEVLLHPLSSWLADLELGAMHPEPLSVSFLYLFHQALKIILLGGLEGLSSDSEAEMGREYEQLVGIARGMLVRG
ncbi:hypothetical protein B0T26DRAFT_742433 [Lasiosphaeria miniovina]|uniref:Zn(2)-C6 fungal-type domain-containing protein n=1 Tax=Lasiosphaeria miniovina TaxID=1954250 RepID=A0AA40DUJ9_9PEZI|nr:uncharacterized protein B0T26DRAFT_742433 [Lasiosphaeria miniovina]KAK0713947.1 hypothetical protein B0T26DRAFT_742433 [Lasiosphaeria miniovina]